MSSSNPSTYKVVQKAQGDKIKDLKQKYAQMETLVNDLQEDLTKVIRDNKKLRNDVDTAMAAYEDTRNQLESVNSEQKTLKQFQSRATRLLAALTSGQNVDKIRGDILTSALGSQDPHKFLQALVGNQSGSEHDDGDNNQPGAPEVVGEATATSSIQEELRDSPKMRKVVSTSLCRLVGATTRLKFEHMRFPEGLLPQDPGWPSTREGQDRQPYSRFDFTKKHDDPVNIETFRKWCQYVRTRGAELEPESRSVLEQASDTTIQARCRIKYDYQAGQCKKHLSANAPSEAQGANEEDENAATPQSSLAEIRSRGDGKLKRRTRQLALIPEGEYTEMERRTFLTPGSMSADEYVWETGPDGVKQKQLGVFVTHPYSYLSNRYKTMKAHVDSIPDPSPPRGYATRIVGEPHDGPPPRTQGNQYALRVWMVKKDVLDANPEWLRTRRVVPDDEPVDTSAVSKKRKKTTQQETSSAGPSRIETTRVWSQLRQAKATYNADLGGHSLDELRDDLNNLADNEEEGEGELGDGDSDGEEDS